YDAVDLRTPRVRRDQYFHGAVFGRGPAAAAIFESHAITIAISCLIRVTVRAAAVARAPPPRANRNNPVIDKWDFAAAIRLAEFFSSWHRRVYLRRQSSAAPGGAGSASRS